MHQFTKVEMFIICEAAQSENFYDELLTIQTDILNAVGLHYRVLHMPPHELGASAFMKHGTTGFVVLWCFNTTLLLSLVHA